VDNLLSEFSVVGPDKAILLRARSLVMSDFEDAVVASVAEAARCDYVVTRNVADFAGSPVSAITPSDFLAVLATAGPPPPATP